jgi:CPA1 family monovalent cation:H+ antiporter
MQDALALILQIFLIAAAVGLLAKRLGIHYNIALVLAGVVVSASRLLTGLSLNPEIVLQVFLPLLLFEAAIATDVRRLRENLGPVVLLAVPGMLATLFVAGAVLAPTLDLSWPVALLLGSILAATDTIAVIAGFRKVRAPSRLTTIVENESLFNDGTALVAFTTLVGVVERGRFEPVAGVAELAWVTGAGLTIGWAVGWLATVVMSRTDDHLMEILLTLVATYGSSLLAERAHASPILAVVTAGITVGALGSRVLTPSGKVAIQSFWEFAAFGVNSFVFLLIGLQVQFPALAARAPAVGWGLVAVTLGRMAAIYPFLALQRLFGEPVPLRWQHMLVWGNLKGSLSMVLALSLPASFPERDLLTAVVFGCALVTLTVQGLTLARLGKALGLGQAGEGEQQLEEQQGRLLAARAGQAELDRMQHLGLLPLGVFQRLRATYQGTIARSERQLRDLLIVHSAEAPHLRALRRHLLTVEKGALRDAVTSGMLSDEVAATLAADIDRVLADLGAPERR